MEKKIIVVLVILAVVGVGTYYLVFNNNYNSNATPNNVAPVAQSKVSPTSETSVSNTQTTSDVTVNIKNFSFNPKTLNIKTGVKITWVNNDSVPHTVTSDSGNMLNSPTLSPGQSFSFTFSNIDSVNYHCGIHPAMKGKVVVEK